MMMEICMCRHKTHADESRWLPTCIFHTVFAFALLWGSFIAITGKFRHCEESTFSVLNFAPHLKYHMVAYIE